MNKIKKVKLQFSGAEAIVLQQGTELVKNLPETFEVSIQGEEEFRCSVRLMKKNDKKHQYVADISLEYFEDIKQWR